MPQSALRQFTPQSAEPAVRSYNPFNPAFRETMRSGITDLLGGRAMGGTPSQRYRAGMADMLTGAVDFVPGVGEAVGVTDTVQAARGGNYGTAAILGGATALGMLPVVGDAASKAVRGGLDMSTAARMQRAAEQGKTVDVYHGTNADYSSFDPERLDIGLHVGTPEQAANRLRDTANPLIGGRSSYYASGANILPLKANLGNSLVMPDVGDWGDSLQVLEELKNVKGFDKSKIQALIDDAEEAMSSSSLKGMTWTETPENKSFLNEIKDIIAGRGYDSIKYQNAVENDYYDLADITDEAKNIKRELGYGLDYFERKVRGRMPRIPEVNDPDVAERMQEYLGAKFDDYILPEEAQAMDSLKAQMRAVDSDPKYLKDTSSYIILDPARNVSSRFAAFDPSKRGSGNIMAGAAGAAAGLSALRGLQSDEQERKPD